MIAITGALGFIGSNLAHRLAAAGCELFARRPPVLDDQVAELVGLSHFRFTADSVFLDELRANEFILDAVFHLGACSSTTETNWEYLLRNNVNFSQEVWAWCARAQVPVLLCLKRGDLWQRIAGIR